MNRALIGRELREHAALLLLAPILGQRVAVTLSDEGHFSSFDLTTLVFYLAIAVAALAWYKTRRPWDPGTELFLLHRPARIRRIVAIRLAVVAGLIIVSGGAGILGAALWALVPGHCAAPFDWTDLVGPAAATVGLVLTWLTVCAVGYSRVSRLGVITTALVAGLWPTVLWSSLLDNWHYAVATALAATAVLAPTAVFAAPRRDY